MDRSPLRPAAGASAPGKLMIAGEYAVLEGGRALVAAVGARAKAFWSAGRDDDSPRRSCQSPENPSIPPEAVLARTRAEEECGRVPHELCIDVTALRHSGRKLGLGSSAAAAAAAAGAVFAWAGHALGQLEVRRRVLEVALAGHRAVAPEGSGADVAAAVLGGMVQFQRQGGEVHAEPLAWPRGLQLRVVWTGGEARTSALIEAVQALRARAPERYRTVMGTLHDAASQLVDAFAAGRPEAVAAAAEAQGQAMEALGVEAGAPIVEQRLRRVAELARDAGGAAKPSGAGGGDVAVAFFADDSAARRFDEACRREQLLLLPLELGAPGVLPLDH